MTVLTTFEKQPVEVQDYDISFVSWLASLSDTIISASATVDTGITLISCSHTAGVVKVWLSGGSDGTTYTAVVLVTTAGGRVKQVEIQIKVKDK
jgi:hypothetical protein